MNGDNSLDEIHVKDIVCAQDGLGPRNYNWICWNRSCFDPGRDETTTMAHGCMKQHCIKNSLYNHLFEHQNVQCCRYR